MMRRSAVSISFGSSWRKKPPQPLGALSSGLCWGGVTAGGGQGGSAGGGQGGTGDCVVHGAAGGCGGRTVDLGGGGGGRRGAFFGSWIRSRR